MLTSSKNTWDASRITWAKLTFQMIFISNQLSTVFLKHFLCQFPWPHTPLAFLLPMLGLPSQPASVWWCVPKFCPQFPCSSCSIKKLISSGPKDLHLIWWWCLHYYLQPWLPLGDPHAWLLLLRWHFHLHIITYHPYITWIKQILISPQMPFLSSSHLWKCHLIHAVAWVWNLRSILESSLFWPHSHSISKSHPFSL